MSLDAFVDALASHGVTAVADVRRFPKSRRHPHFNDQALATELPRRGIAYWPFTSLGGRRQPRPDSTNTAWRNDSFRGYADYMQTAEFKCALDELARQAETRPTAVMCAEAVPWRCHRSLIADALLVRGWRVLDILGPAKASAHELTRFARVDRLRIRYPAPESDGSQSVLFDAEHPATDA